MANHAAVVSVAVTAVDIRRGEVRDSMVGVYYLYLYVCVREEKRREEKREIIEERRERSSVLCCCGEDNNNGSFWVISPHTAVSVAHKYQIVW